MAKTSWYYLRFSFEMFKLLEEGVRRASETAKRD